MKTKISEILKNKGNKVVSVKSGSTIIDAVRLMNENKIGSVVVLDKKDKIIGIVTERDVMCEVASKKGVLGDGKVDDIMSKNIVIGVPNDDVGYLIWDM